jgi:HK97 family phage major capsid protein/HK97 family phage prohead protease
MTDHLSYEVRYATTADGEVSGLASCFGQEDAAGDIVSPGAFKRTLAEHRAVGRMPAMLWSHNTHEPIGKWTSIEETAEGLHVKGRLNLQTQRGAEARALLLDDCISGLSIGFRTRSAERRSRGRVLTDLDLLEASLVVLPCAPNARISSVKGSPMTVELSLPDDGAETAAAELPPEVLERIDNLEAKAAAAEAKVDRLETRLSRPSARVEVKEDVAELERKAFNAFCRKGPEGIGEIERKVLSAGVLGSPSADGSTLVPQTFLNELMRNLVEISPMRQVARVQQVSGTPVLLPKRTANLTASWVAETAEHALSQPAYGQQSIPVFEARVTVEVTNQLLEDAAFDLSAELARDFAEEFARLEGIAFVDGNGTSQPEGFRTSSLFVTTGGAITADSLIDLYHSVASIYSGRGTWLMPRSVMGSVRKLKTSGTGVYLWTDNLQPGQPSSLLGRPIVEMPDMVDTGSPSPATVAFGDWSRGYRIFDRIGLEILRDPFSKAKFSVVQFHARRRVGGALVDGQAVHGLSG